MINCSNCKLSRKRWNTVNGFQIGDRTYCCMGCGFTGCVCIIIKPKKKAVIKFRD